MTADLAYGFAITGADDVARSMQSVASQLERLTQRQQQNAQSGRQMAQAGQTAAQSFGQMVQAGHQLTQRFQSVAGAVQSLVGQLGGQDRTAGMVASVAANIAQFASFGSMIGPGGTVAGAVVGLTSSLVSMARANDDVAASARRAGEELASLANQRLADRRAEDMDRRISSGTLGGVGASDLEREREERRIEIDRLEAEYDSVRARARRSREMFEGAGRSVPESISRAILGDVERLRGERQLLVDEIDNINAELGERSGALGGGDDDRPHRGGGGGSRTDAAAEEARAWRELLTSINDTAEGTLVLIEEERAARSVGNESTGERGGGQSRAQSAFGDLRTASFGETDFFGEQTRAYADFERSATGSLDAVIAAYERLAETSASSAREVSRSGNLMARGIEGVANDIGGAVGGDMLGAFDKAVGAWLDGSKSFVEAAEEMAKGVLKALVQEGIVQAVAETARAIADIAGYRYDSAALHFAAAAAWGAVAGVAGGIGAATGAFGGGGAGAQEAAGSRELADRNQGDQQQGGTTVINLYPGGYITRDEVAGGMIDALNFAGRNGRTLDSRLLRGA